VTGVRVLIASLLLLASAGAQAHAHLQQSTPADGSVIATAPAKLVLRFSEAAQLTALSITKQGGARQELAPLPDRAQATIEVALPALTPGRYEVSWRAVSGDGHVMPGTIHFTLGQ
jgi:methionine-rich copper-binding protein CopC